MKKLTYFALSALATNLLVGCGDNMEPDDQAVQEEPVAFPRTCAEVAQGHANWGDGKRTLYIGNDETKPWTAYCVDLQSKTPKEYLTVTATWSDFSGASPDDHVRTDYDMVRIDPLTLKLDTSDQTFATSTGTATYLGVAVTSMPLGVAMSCGHNFATAQVHLGDTPFVIENHFALRGDAIAGGGANPWASNRVIEMFADADCGAIAPDLMSTSLVNDAGGFVISLSYSK